MYKFAAATAVFFALFFSVAALAWADTSVRVGQYDGEWKGEGIIECSRVRGIILKPTITISGGEITSQFSESNKNYKITGKVNSAGKFVRTLLLGIGNIEAFRVSPFARVMGKLNSTGGVIKFKSGTNASVCEGSIRFTRISSDTPKIAIMSDDTISTHSDLEPHATALTGKAAKKAEANAERKRIEEEAARKAEAIAERKRIEEERQLAEQKSIITEQATTLIRNIEAFAKTSPRQIDFLLLLELFHKAKPIIEGEWSIALRDDYIALRNLVINNQGFVAFQKAEVARQETERHAQIAGLQNEVRSNISYLENIIVENFSSPSAPEAASLINSLRKNLLSEDPTTLEAGVNRFVSFIEKVGLQTDLSTWERENRKSKIASTDNKDAPTEGAGVLQSPDEPDDTEVPDQVVENSDAIAVVIGNKSYGDHIPEVSFAHNDADAVKRYLIEKLGYREGNIVDVRDATKAQLEAIFGNQNTHKGKLYNYVRADISDVTVFYSGHGVPDPKSLRGYLLPVDADPDVVAIAGYPLDVMLLNLSKIPARSMHVFLDACFSGDSPKGMIIRATSGIMVKAKLPQVTSKMVVITAAQGNQYASWDEDAQNGLFTKHLLVALNGMADTGRYGNGDRTITVDEVKNYLDLEMTYQARRRFGRDQVASISGDGDRVLVSHSN